LACTTLPRHRPAGQTSQTHRQVSRRSRTRFRIDRLAPSCQSRSWKAVDRRLSNRFFWIAQIGDRKSDVITRCEADLTQVMLVRSTSPTNKVSQRRGMRIGSGAGSSSLLWRQVSPERVVIVVSFACNTVRARKFRDLPILLRRRRRCALPFCTPSSSGAAALSRAKPRLVPAGHSRMAGAASASGASTNTTLSSSSGADAARTIWGRRRVVRDSACLAPSLPRAIP